MACCYFPSFICTSRKPGTLSSLHGVEQLFKWEPQQRRACTFLVLASSAKNPSRRKSKVTKPNKSNIDLCEELHEFISIAGLPPTHVPSLKELSQHGRQDLANIVRRRGYKFIADILKDSAKRETEIERTQAENKDFNDGEKESTGQDKKRSDLAEEISLLSREDSSVGSHLLSNTDSQINQSINSSVTSPILEKKAAKFVQTGELDTAEGAPKVEDIQIPSCLNLSYGILGPYNGDASDLFTTLNVETIVSSHENSISQANGCNTESITNAGAMISEQAILPFTEHHLQRNDISSSKGEIDIGFSDDNSAAEDSRKDHQIEIDQLKAMLHQKELELFELRRQIENEKVTLSLLETKATTEIGNAQRIISEKEAQLLAAEESLYGLKEVRIEYWGDGEVVEVAGSFNGWHHRIKMEQGLLPQVLNPDRSREPVMWSAVLWLYPGIYEIKFIVDGHWRIDPCRELISKGNIQNNILRVDR